MYQTGQACFQVMGLLTHWQKCKYGALVASNGSVLSHLLLITVNFFFFSFLFHVQTSSSTSVLFFFLLFFFFFINIFLPPLTSLPLKNLLRTKHLASRREPIQLRKLLTEERLDRREAWPIAGGALSLKTLWFLFLLWALLKFNNLLLEQKVFSIITLSQLICQTNTIVPCSWIGIPFIVHTVYTQ